MTRRRKLVSLRSLLGMERDFIGYRAGAGGRGHRKGGRRGRSIGGIFAAGAGTFLPTHRRKRRR